MCHVYIQGMTISSLLFHIGVMWFGLWYPSYPCWHLILSVFVWAIASERESSEWLYYLIQLRWWYPNPSGLSVRIPQCRQSKCWELNNKSTHSFHKSCWQTFKSNQLFCYLWTPGYSVSSYTFQSEARVKKGQAFWRQLDWFNAEQKCVNFQKPLFTCLHEVCSLWELTFTQWLPLWGAVLATQNGVEKNTESFNHPGFATFRSSLFHLDF